MEVFGWYWSCKSRKSKFADDGLFGVADDRLSLSLLLFADVPLSLSLFGVAEDTTINQENTLRQRELAPIPKFAHYHWYYVMRTLSWTGTI